MKSQFDFIYLQKNRTKDMVLKYINLYGYHILIHRQKENDFEIAFGNRGSTIGVDSEDLEHFGIKAIIGGDQMTFIANKASASVEIYTSNEADIQRGDIVEINIGKDRIYYNVINPIETFHDFFYKVSLNPYTSEVSKNV